MDNALQERSIAVAKRVASSVQLTIWNIYRKSYDRKYSAEFAAAILDAEMQSSFVNGIKVFGNFGHLYTGKIKIAETSVVYSPELHDKQWLASKKRLRHPIRVGLMTIGNVEVNYNDEEFADNLYNSLILDITQIALVSFLFVGSLYLVLRIALVSPMQSLQITQQALDSLDEAVFVIDETGRLIDVNPSYSKITGYEQDEIMGEEPQFHAEEYPQMSVIELIHLVSDNSDSWTGEIVGSKKNGSQFPGWLNIHRVQSQDDSIRYVGVLNDIEEKKDAERKLHHLAYFDSLTQVPNRYSFMSKLESEIQLAAKKETVLALLYIDLDNFKWTNDSFGHEVGDKLLIEISRRFLHCLQSNESLYRIGGDEFTIIVNDFSDTEELLALADRIVHSARDDLSIDGHKLRPGASLGISTFPADAGTARDLIKRADSAMFQAKEQGRGQVCFFSSSLEERRVIDQQVAQGLKGALVNDELLLVYQPKVVLNDGQFSAKGVEALLRWQKNGELVYPPDVFIPVAEQSNLICEIGYWVIDAACKQLWNWRKQGVRGICVAINLSPKQFRDNKLLSYLQKSFVNYGIKPGELEVEITESAVIEDIENSILTLNQLRALGITIAMDDFGTGYSSLSYLKQLPIDVLKIDRSFISKIPFDQDDVAIVKAIFSMAEALGIEVVAEGVETRDQLDFLIASHCHIGQGFYFSKPLVAEKFIRWLEEDSLTSNS